jgi:hypothetical protein
VVPNGLALGFPMRFTRVLRMGWARTKAPCPTIFLGLDEMSKTKRVSGVDLGPDCFAYVGNIEDRLTWLCPLLVRGDEAKTVNLIKSSLFRFNQTKGLPDHERVNVWYTLFGAARSHGIHVERREFPRTTPEPPAAEVKAIEIDEKQGITDRELAVLLAQADQRADAFLKQLGLE